MKILIFCVLATIISGCTKPASKATDNSKSTPASSQTTAVHPVEPIPTEMAETRERKAINAGALELLLAGKYDQLDALARTYRTSKECYGDGMWKLREVYNGMIPGKQSPDSEWEKRLAVFRQWIAARPESITARVALADTLTSYAWKARGSGYANTVTRPGWKLFGDRLIESVQVLTDAKSIKENCPRWWSVMLTAGLGLGFEKTQYNALFVEAIKSHPGYTGYYCQMAYYLLPRWHGDPQDTAKFLQTAADQIGGEDGDLVYARVAWFLQGIEGNVFDDRRISWDRTEKGFQVMQQRFPDSLYVRNGRAYIAVMGCPKTLLPQRLVNELDGKIDLGAWTSKENFKRLTKNLYPRQAVQVPALPNPLNQRS